MYIKFAIIHKNYRPIFLPSQLIKCIQERRKSKRNRLSSRQIKQIPTAKFSKGDLTFYNFFLFSLIFNFLFSCYFFFSLFLNNRMHFILIQLPSNSIAPKKFVSDIHIFQVNTQSQRSNNPMLNFQQNEYQMKVEMKL